MRRAEVFEARRDVERLLGSVDVVIEPEGAVAEGGVGRERRDEQDGPGAEADAEGELRHVAKALAGRSDHVKFQPRLGAVLDEAPALEQWAASRREEEVCGPVVVQEVALAARQGPAELRAELARWERLLVVFALVVISEGDSCDGLPCVDHGIRHELVHPPVRVSFGRVPEEFGVGRSGVALLAPLVYVPDDVAVGHDREAVVARIFDDDLGLKGAVDVIEATEGDEVDERGRSPRWRRGLVDQSHEALGEAAELCVLRLCRRALALVVFVVDRVVDDDERGS